MNNPVRRVEPAWPPAPEDFRQVRNVIAHLEELDARGASGPISDAERKQFWISFDRIWPGPNRWDYRLLTFLAGAAFVFVVEFAILMALDFTNAVRPRSDTIKLHVQALAEQVETSIGRQPF